MLKAEPEEKKEKEENKFVELPEEKKDAASDASVIGAASGAPKTVSIPKDAAAELEAAAVAGMEVMDVAAKKRGESEEREIKEAKKIVETLIPESTKLAGIKEAVGGASDCCATNSCGGGGGGTANDSKVAEEEQQQKSAPSSEKPVTAEGDVAANASASASKDAGASSSPTGATSGADPTDDDDASFERLSKDIVKRSARAVKSLKDNEFDIRFNPDIFQIGVRHAQEEQDLETYEREKVLIKEAADFLLGYQV